MSAASTTGVPCTDCLSELCRLSSPQDVRKYIAQHPEVATHEFVELLAETVRQYIRVDVPQALRAGEAACVIAGILGDQDSMGRALRAKANALSFNGQCKSGLELLLRAVELFEAADRPDEVGRTLSTSIQPLILLGEYNQALENAAKARDIFTQQGDNLRLARLELNVANIHHRQEKFGEALAGYERACQSLLPYGDIEATAVALHNMAVCLISLDDFERALAVYSQARTFFQTHSMPVLVAQADYNIAYLYYLRGDYERALSSLSATRKSCAQNGDRYHAALCDLDQSEVYLELNLTEEAAQMAQSAVEQFEQLGMGYEKARSIVNLGIATTRKRDTASALAIFRRAKAVFVQEGHRAGEALADLYEAVLLVELGDYRTAKRLCLSASQFFRSMGLFRKAVISELLLSHLALIEGNPAVARTCCDAALQQLQPLQAPSLTCQALLLSGRIYEAAGAEAQAFEAYEAARNELESVRSGLQGEELKIAFMTNKVEVYEQLVGLCLKRGFTGPSAKQALAYMESAKSRSLVDSICGKARSLPARAGSNGPVEGEIDSLRGRLNWYYHRIEAEQMRPEGVSRTSIENLWDQAREHENQLLSALRNLPGGCMETQQRLRGPSVTLDNIRAALEPGTTLIEYFQVGDQLVAAVLKERGLNIVPLATMTRVKNAVRMLQSQFWKYSLGPEYRKGLESQLGATTLLHLQQLYRQLIAPLREFVGGKHLVIVPHGILHYLPIHALHDGDSFLIDEFTISYAPSASLYALARTPRDASGKRALILGIHDSNTPSILNEVHEVASVVTDATLLLGSDASYDALQRFAAESRLIHIATHGYFRSDNPMFSAVKLAESYLSVCDLYKLHLPVDLLTLSGCGTGLNVVAPGDELIGLTRGLLSAGAKALLLSLWDVHDRSTAEFMRAFYSHWSNNRDKAAAVRAAMLDVRDRYSHPYHWAPFTLVGNAS